MKEMRALGPVGLTLAIGFSAGFGALSWVLAALSLVLATGAGSASMGSAFLAAAGFVMIAFGRLPDTSDGKGWASWLAGALLVVGSLWCLSEPWRGEPLQYTTLFFIGSGGAWVPMLLAGRPPRDRGRRAGRWLGAALGGSAFVSLFWPWLVSVFERALQFAASPVEGVGAEILVTWVLVGIAVLAFLSISASLCC